MISIVTPWHNASELCTDYERSHKGAQIITIDNASEPQHAQAIKAMTERMGGVYIRNETNRLFAPANNQGYAVAANDVVMFLNSDTSAVPGWVDTIEDEIKDGALYSPSIMARYVDHQPILYAEGWCIAATRRTWGKIGLWPENLPGMYWEDNILSLNALKAGVQLKSAKWPVKHINNYTSRKTIGAYDSAGVNRIEFERMVREWRLLKN